MLIQCAISSASDSANSTQVYNACYIQYNGWDFKKWASLVESSSETLLGWYCVDNKLPEKTKICTMIVVKSSILHLSQISAADSRIHSLCLTGKL